MPPLALAVKLVHAALFLLLAAAALYVFACGVIGRRGRLLGPALAVCALELGVLAWNHWVCPLSTLAVRLGARSGTVADWFLPEWSMRFVFPAFGAIIAAGAVLLLVRWGMGRLPARSPKGRRGA